MKHMNRIVAFSLLLGTSAALAAETSNPQRGNLDPQQRQQRVEQMKARWAQVDANHDGQLSREEMQQGAPRMAQHFDKLDLNGDGQVTADEMRQAQQARKAERPARSKPSQE